MHASTPVFKITHSVSTAQHCTRLTVKQLSVTHFVSFFMILIRQECTRMCVSQPVLSIVIRSVSFPFCEHSLLTAE